jgi:protein subunit release factor A
MPTASELVNLAVKLSRKNTDEKIAHLQAQIDELKQLIEKLLPPEDNETEVNLITCRRCGQKGHWTLGCKR